MPCPSLNTSLSSAAHTDARARLAAPSGPAAAPPASRISSRQLAAFLLMHARAASLFLSASLRYACELPEYCSRWPLMDLNWVL